MAYYAIPLVSVMFAGRLGDLQLAAAWRRCAGKAPALPAINDSAAASSGGAAPDPEFPVLPAINDSTAADAYTSRLRSLASEEHPVNVPRHVQEHMLVTLAVNMIVCSPNEHCQGPRWGRCMSQIGPRLGLAPRSAM
ncbi:unnamed protein product [Miscanthus lutarioriparius]|uniref:Uncharacterized protein n=1 Tax=Miscanthus lutarioriparius TaxID=422564 RepID=A0A811PYR8_9POAL|nr:unnamed protein product [Miscanthus lutarioriparius]